MSQIATILGALKDTDSTEGTDSMGGKLGRAGDLAWPWHGSPIWQIVSERAGARTRRKLARMGLFPLVSMIKREDVFRSRDRRRVPFGST